MAILISMPEFARAFDSFCLDVQERSRQRRIVGRLSDHVVEVEDIGLTSRYRRDRASCFEPARELQMWLHTHADR